MKTPTLKFHDANQEATITIPYHCVRELDEITLLNLVTDLVEVLITDQDE